ncbi:MAG: hypothetical protein JXR83_00790 [Deltaproteobacteria bacterium]|nr:hypothetical protein [Deltaproteobacteria bacterium]
MKRTLAMASTIGLLAAIALAGCGAEHLTATHGRATANYYRMQLVDPDAGKQSVVSVGLDCSEAAIVAKNYYDSLEAEGSGGEEEQQVLILSPTKEPAANLPPPSVPEGAR